MLITARIAEFVGRSRYIDDRSTVGQILAVADVKEYNLLHHGTV